jgi:hypothetical protein
MRWIPRLSIVMQVQYLHMQKELLVLYFFTQSEDVLRNWRSDSEYQVHVHLRHLHQYFREAPNLKRISTCGCSPIDPIATMLEVQIVAFKASSTICHMASMQVYGSATDSYEQEYPNSNKCTRFSLIDETHGEVAVPLFGLNHQRWLTTPLLLVLRFNSVDTLSLSSVSLLRYLQLSTPQPQVHTPDRPLGEPSTGHQLVWSIEAFEDYNCGIFESELSADDRSPFGSTCSLRRLLQELLPSCFVQLSSLVSCSDVKSHIMMYSEPQC